MDGWIDTPSTVTSTRAPAVLKTKLAISSAPVSSHHYILLSYLKWLYGASEQNVEVRQIILHIYGWSFVWTVMQPQPNEHLRPLRHHPSNIVNRKPFDN